MAMFINLSKCVVLHYDHRLPLNYTYLLFGTNITSEEMVQDLGINFDTQLKSDKDISAIVRNTNYHLLSLVCLLLEHNISVWFSSI